MSHSLPLVAGICLCFYFSYHTYFGERSVSKLRELHNIEMLQGESLSSLKAEKAMLEAKVSLLRPETLSRDMVEQQAQFILGYASDDTIVVLGN